MEILTIKITETDSQGIERQSLVPIDQAGFRQFSRLPTHQPIKIQTKVRRNNRTNSHLWAVCSYVVENLPERYWYEENGDKHPAFPSTEVLHEWLKVKVGFGHVMPVNITDREGETMIIPRRSNFFALEDENEYQEKFYRPSMELLARIMDMAESELTEQSIAWSKGSKTKS